MPIYEFLCNECGNRFEGLSDAGTEAAACPRCGAQNAPRVLSTPGRPMRLVKSSGDRRKQERKNARLHSRAKERFSAARRAPKGGGR
jgi:putative FmdB family regulatory protein